MTYGIKPFFHRRFSPFTPFTTSLFWRLTSDFSIHLSNTRSAKISPSIMSEISMNCLLKYFGVVYHIANLLVACVAGVPFGGERGLRGTGCERGGLRGRRMGYNNACFFYHYETVKTNQTVVRPRNACFTFLRMHP